MNEFHLKYRPTKLSQVFGQDSAVSMLRGFVRSKTVPHALLFTGNSGCGKTTLARILARQMRTFPVDVETVNAANYKGIDMVRQITSTMNMRPLKSKQRFYIIDEAHQLTKQAQDAFLIPLEDTPRHVHFALCTTEPNALKKTIRTRCTNIEVRSLSDEAMAECIRWICSQEQYDIDEEILDRIVQVAEGSAREGVKLLNGIVGIEDIEDQRDYLQKRDAQTAAIDLCRAIMGRGSSWTAVAKILRDIDGEPESIRRAVLGYASSILLKKNDKKCALVLECFSENVFDSGKPGLVLQAYNCFSEMK